MILAQRVTLGVSHRRRKVLSHFVNVVWVNRYLLLAVVTKTTSQ